MNWFSNFEQAKEESTKAHKPILLQFEMDGCGGCNKLYKETYLDNKVQEEMQNWFVLLKLDLIKEREIRKQLSAYWTPSFYFLDQNGKSYFNFNGYIPPKELRIILRLGFAETMIPKGKYTEAIQVLLKDFEELKDSPLASKLLITYELANYIKTKDKDLFMKGMKNIQLLYPNSLEAKMYFWDE